MHYSVPPASSGIPTCGLGRKFSGLQALLWPWSAICKYVCNYIPLGACVPCAYKCARPLLPDKTNQMPFRSRVQFRFSAGGEVWTAFGCKWYLFQAILQTSINMTLILVLFFPQRRMESWNHTMDHSPVLEQPSYNVFAAADWNKSRTSCQRPAFSPALTWQLCNCAAEQLPHKTLGICWSCSNSLHNCLHGLAFYPPQFSRAMTYMTCIAMPFFCWHFFI